MDLGSYKQVYYTEEQQKRLHVDYHGETRLGGDSGLGPRWTRDDDFEKPAGIRDNGSFQE